MTSNFAIVRRVDALAFDFDGTLVDTRALHMAASFHAAPAVLGRDVDVATVRASLGLPLPDSMRVIATGVIGGGASSVDGAAIERAIPALVASFLAYYTAHQRRMVHLFPGVPETLAELRRRGYPLALLSNKLRDWGRAELADIGLAEQFAVTVFAEDMPVPKPSGAALAPVLAALGLPATRVLLVGDGAADIACARDAGAPVAAALWGAVAPTALLALKPDYILQTIGDVLDVATAS